MYCDSVERLFVVRRDGAVVEALGQVAQQVADPHARRAGIARADRPDQRRFVRRIADREHLHIELVLLAGADDAKHDRVRIDLRVGPGEIDLVLAFDQRHDPLFFDQRGVGVVELNFHPLADRQRDEFHAARLGGGLRRSDREATAHERLLRECLNEDQTLVWKLRDPVLRGIVDRRGRRVPESCVWR